MNIRELKEMLQLMEDHGLSEMDIEKDGLKIRFKKALTGQVITTEMAGVSGGFIPMPAMGEMRQGKPPEGGAVPVQDNPNLVLVRSPMVGTFYAAPAPDQPPYVTVGKKIKEGDVLCIVEAMKLMNEIKSEITGTVTEVLVKNGQPVEFDQPLFKVEKG